MVAKHPNSLINTLSEKLKERKKSKAQLAIETGIPKDRIYKWFQEGTSPKADDAKKIMAWINNVEETTHGMEAIISTTAELSKVIGELSEEIVRLNARVTVVTTTLALSVSTQTGKPIAYVSSEIAESIDKETDRLLVELRKKQKGSF